MKKYYLKQKVFAIRDRYKVYDEDQKLAYHCEGKLFSISRRMDFYRSEDKTHLYTIKRKIFTVLPKYFLTTIDGRQVAQINKKWSFVKHKFDIHSEMGELTMEGNFWGHDFNVKLGETLLLEVHKKWISWGDTYEITIHDESKSELLVALVLMIDDCLHDNQNKGSN